MKYYVVLISTFLSIGVYSQNSPVDSEESLPPRTDNFVNLSKVFSDKSQVSFSVANYYNYIASRDSSFNLDAHITPNYYFGDEIDENNMNTPLRVNL
ncbi:MAG TPA: hypothetical protein DCW83_14575 [Saprospirales bacterium]|jgi:hypothetical protein|nr:hypothetical protein [Saprospiraceae bacterium]HAW05907.1 hypothetical protein [Saprospirales bacterium]